MDLGVLVGFAAGVIAGVAFGSAPSGERRAPRQALIPWTRAINTAPQVARERSSALPSGGREMTRSPGPVLPRPLSGADTGVQAPPVSIGGAQAVGGNTAPDGTARATGNAPAIDLDALTDALWDELHGDMDRRLIREVLAEATLRYRDARIATFIPIFVRRDALRILRGRA